MNKLVRVRDGNVLEIRHTDGIVLAEVRPGYEEFLGPCIHLYRVSVFGGEPEKLLTLQIPTVTELVRRLPIVIAASRRLQARAKKPAK